MYVTNTKQVLSSLLAKWAQMKGFRAAWIPVSAVAEAVDRVSRLCATGRIDEALSKQTFPWLDSSHPYLNPAEKSIIIVAVPRPAHVLAFEYGGEDHELIVPPTYINFRGISAEAGRSLELLFDGRVPIRAITAPLKGMAVLSGFAKYGLNNITYVDGLGSYVQLLAFATPVEVPPDHAEPKASPSVLEECAACGACLRGCPTRAIRKDRFLLHAEECLTYFSEVPGELPEKFASLKRRCLVGCLVCQETCPVNKGKLKWEKLDVRFTPADIEFILGEHGDGDPAPELCVKLASLRCREFSTPDGHPTDFLRRNLRVLLKCRR